MPDARILIHEVRPTPAFEQALGVLAAGGVTAARASGGGDDLPVVLVDGEELCRGRYPSLHELAHALGLTGDDGGSACDC